MAETFVVIASNSFSGAHFVDYLLSRGEDVVGMSRSDQPEPVFLPYRHRETGSFTFRRLDLNHHVDEILRVIDELQAPYVVNFAAQSMVGQSWQYPTHWFRTNTLSTIALHDGLRQLPFLRRYVHISTPEVYGTSEGLVPEHTVYHPSTPYAVSRAAADMSLASFHSAYGFPVVFTRAANVFGPHQQLYRLIPKAILFFLLGRTFPLHGGGHSVRSFIHIEDVARGTYKAAKSAVPGEIFHLSTTRNISIRGVVQIIAEKLGVRFDDAVEVAEERLGKDKAYLLDSSKAREQLGWEPQHSLEAGIDATIRWVEENLDVLSELPAAYVHKE